MNAVPAPRRPVPWLTAAAVAVAVVLLAALWRSDEPPPQALHALAVPQPLPPIARPAAPPPQVTAPAPAAPAPPVVLDATAPDLRSLHDEYAGSGDPRARRMAARALQACIPLFVPASGDTPSPEALIQSLPAADHAEREQAYRTLFARCHGFVEERPEAIADMQAQLQADRPAQDPGRRARQALVNGEADEAARIVAGALTGTDPAAVASLSGIAVRLARSDGDASDPSALQRAAAVDAALPLVACDLGLDCSAQSLAALQLCALAGACDGDLSARLATRLGPAPPDAAAIEAQRDRLRTLLADGRVLSANDLLGPP